MVHHVSILIIDLDPVPISWNLKRVCSHRVFGLLLRKSPGYRQKRQWLEARFAEGLKLHMVHEIGGRKLNPDGVVLYLHRANLRSR